jgi:hypothetical protein
MTTDAVPHVSNLAMRAIEDAEHPTLIEAADALSERTVRAMKPGPARAPTQPAAFRPHRH